MGSGVPLFDYNYNNDRRLDIFAVNGAPVSAPMAKGSVPQKTGPEYWNRLYRNNGDGTVTDVTARLAWPAPGTEWASLPPIMTMTAKKIFT